jgi:hypothetical protein
MLGGSCGGLNEEYSIWVIEGQTHFGMPSGAKMYRYYMQNNEWEIRARDLFA